MYIYIYCVKIFSFFHFCVNICHFLHKNVVIVGLPWAHTSPGAPTSPRATGPTEARKKIFWKKKVVEKKNKNKNIEAVYQLKKTSDYSQIHPPGPEQNLEKKKQPKKK